VHGIVVRDDLDDRECRSGGGSAVQFSSGRQQCDLIDTMDSYPAFI
jgi:hypothetical protein